MNKNNNNYKNRVSKGAQKQKRFDRKRMKVS